MKKQCKVVMLPTEKKSNICKGIGSKNPKDNKICYFDNDNLPNDNLTQRQHLYILSDDKIKEGDWIMEVSVKQLQKHVKVLMEIIQNGGEKSLQQLILP